MPESFTESATMAPKVLPIALSRFLSSLRGTRLEVYGGVLRAKHSQEKHTPAEWHALINALAAKKVTY